MSADIEIDHLSGATAIGFALGRIEVRAEGHDHPTMNIAAVAHMFIFELASAMDDLGGDRRTRELIYESIKNGVVAGLYDSQNEEPLPLDEPLTEASRH